MRSVTSSFDKAPRENTNCYCHEGISELNRLSLFVTAGQFTTSWKKTGNYYFVIINNEVNSCVHSKTNKQTFFMVAKVRGKMSNK